MRAESLGAAAASLALGAVLVVSSLRAGGMLLELPDDTGASVVATEPAFDTVDVAHLLEAGSRSADARREPRPSAAGAPEATTGVAGSGTSEPRGPAPAAAGTDADDVRAGRSDPLRLAPRPSALPSPQPAPARPGGSERRLSEPPAPGPRIRALSESSGPSRRVTHPDPGPSARDAAPSAAPAPGRPLVPGSSPRAAAPAAEPRSLERPTATPPAESVAPADAREPAERGAEPADQPLGAASLPTSGLRVHVGEPTRADRGAAAAHATAGAVGKAELGEPEKSAHADADEPAPDKPESGHGRVEQPAPDEPAPDEPTPDRTGSGRPEAQPGSPIEPATPATPATPKPGARQPDRPPQDPPPAEPATPASPASPAADAAGGRGPAHDAGGDDG